MKILVTGAGGFVGGHLLTHLRKAMPESELHGTILSPEETRSLFAALGCIPHTLDLRDPAGTQQLIAELRPDRIFHLAGQAFVPLSHKDPWETLEVNIRGTLNLLEAVRAGALPTRILVVSSAEIYGPVSADQLPLTENTPLCPTSPYSVSKIAQDMLAWLYARTYRLHVVRARPFNHIGPGQSHRFAVADWASQIAAAEIGLREPVVQVGNLDTQRDLTDVRDVVRAYVHLLDDAGSGEVFNVCSGTPRTMRHVLDTLISFSQVRIEVRVDSEKFRPGDTPILYGDYRLLRERIGWQPQISLEQSLRDVLDEWRVRVKDPASA